MSITKRIKIYSVLFLIGFDQLVKLLISQYMGCFSEDGLSIIPNILYFKPRFNTDYSWFNSLLELGIGRLVHIVMTIAIILIIVLVFNFIKNKKTQNRWIDIMFIFLISGSIASLIDKILWPGSLDYLQLKGYFIFDLKDVYISIFEIITVIMISTNFKAVNDFKMSEFKDYIIEVTKSI